MKKRKVIYAALAALVLIFAIIYAGYRAVFQKGVLPGKDKEVILIPTGSTFDQVLDSLESKLIISNREIFLWIAEKKNYPSLIKPGRYVIESKMSYISLINMLRAGSQAPVKVTFNHIRTIQQLAGKVGRQIEADSASITSFLNNPENYKKDGFTPFNIISVFIPDTYELYWNTSPEGFYQRMLREYSRFWNGERQKKAESQGLTKSEVAILASIIDDEVVKSDEKPRIAGVYINRLKRGMPLQACPTIKFALNDFTITRVLNRHLNIDSPYNTYRHKGFPPGPIGCPTRDGLEAVLNAEKHDYLYFAAKPDFSGYHNFSRTLAEHNRYADQYQRELDRRRIYR